MRPQSIRLFDALFLGGIALGLVAIALTMVGLGHQDSAASVAGPGGTQSALLGAAAFGSVISLTLWYLVSRLRFSFLRWVLLLLVAYGLYTMTAMFGDRTSISTVIGVVASLMELAGVALLFRADARQWFAAPEA